MSNLNIQNRTIFCHDNLEILQGINSNSIDLIYLDPPFNKKKTFIAPIGSSAEGAFFEDLFQLEDIKTEWLTSIKQDNAALHDFLNGIRTMDGRQSYNFCYLAYMSIRLMEMKRILKDTGSIYLHCDPTMSHYLKLVMDCIFGEKQFKNEIAWCYKKLPNNAKIFQRNKDIILFYSRSENYIFNKLYSEPTQGSLKTFETGRRVGYNANHAKKMVTVFNWDKYKQAVKNKKIPEDLKPVEFKHGKPLMRDYWIDIKLLGGSKNKERTGYPTQKPLALLERIIKASCPENGVVLDPFCGCATAPVASEILNRKWIGIDVSVKAYELVKLRLERQFAQRNLFEQPWKDITYNTTPPTRTDTNGNGRPKKWVYVISNPQYDGEYKVGIALNWKSRLNSYQTSDPNRAYNLEFKIHCYNFNEVEKAIHAKFNNRHEWVEGNLELIKTEIKKLAEI